MLGSVILASQPARNKTRLRFKDNHRFIIQGALELFPSIQYSESQKFSENQCGPNMPYPINPNHGNMAYA
jgi:hypothetical protein